MEARGGSIVAEGLERLGVELDNYYGAIAEVQQGSVVEIPEPPEALLYFQMCTQMHIPLVAGGVFDQPHIWLMEYAICEKKSKFYDQQNSPSVPAPSEAIQDMKFAQDI